MPDKPWITLDNRFNAPPEWVQAWLTDFRPDDGQRWFDDEQSQKIARDGKGVRIESAMDMGTVKTTVTVEGPGRWSAQGQLFDKKGAPFVTNRIVETAKADGVATLHHVEIFGTPHTFKAKLMGPVMRPMIRKRLRKAFGRMATAIDAEYKAGKPPTG